MQKIQFIKMHGLGNDFVIIDRRIDNVEINKDIINKLSDIRIPRDAGDYRIISRKVIDHLKKLNVSESQIINLIKKYGYKIKDSEEKVTDNLSKNEYYLSC